VPQTSRGAFVRLRECNRTFPCHRECT
jgi:hypothetical protein